MDNRYAVIDINFLHNCFFRVCAAFVYDGFSSNCSYDTADHKRYAHGILPVAERQFFKCRANPLPSLATWIACRFPAIGPSHSILFKPLSVNLMEAITKSGFSDDHLLDGGKHS
jgi:hypothetical protein